jgi:Icc-related predicted phosphoesterase
MKITVIGDIHGRLLLTSEMDKALTDADLLFLNGDITDFGTPEDLNSVLDELKDHTSARILSVPGNCDTPDVLLETERAGINTHRSGEVVDGLGIFAVGGSNVTPFNTPIEFSEDDISDILADAYERVKDCKSVILFSHFPPKDTTTDQITSGAHVGSEILREFIQSHPNIKLVVCGHIHEGFGEDKVGDIPVVNHGMGADGHFVTIDASPKDDWWDIGYVAH